MRLIFIFQWINVHCKCIGKCTFSAPYPKYYKPFEIIFLGPKLKIFCFKIQNIGLVYWQISRFKRFRLSVIFVKEFLSVLLQPLYILLSVNEHVSVCLFICLSPLFPYLSNSSFLIQEIKKQWANFILSKYLIVSTIHIK